MNTAESSKENSTSSNPDQDTENQDISSFAQDALKEVLGWYGLQESERGRSHSPDGCSSGTPPSSTGDSPTGGVGCGVPDDGERGAQHQDLSAGGSCGGSQLLGSAGAFGGGIASGIGPRARSTSSRKLIGMRYLFPPLSEDLTLLEKARIWVARHDHKYFVGWTEDQLCKVDQVLRPISTVTPELYKLHMNRSEFCRNVKLKYCLESGTGWAEEFREKLARSASNGGFSGLCQAKIAAAELWRKYSDKYKSHQARYPNPKSREQRHRGTECWQEVLDMKIADSGVEDNDAACPPNKKAKAELEAEEEVCCVEVDEEDNGDCQEKIDGDSGSSQEDPELLPQENPDMELHETVAGDSVGPPALGQSRDEEEEEDEEDGEETVRHLDDYPDDGMLDVHTPTPSSTPASLSSPATPQPAPLTPQSMMEQMQGGIHPYAVPPGVRMAAMPAVGMGYGFDPYMDVLMQFPHMDPRQVGGSITHPSATSTESAALARSRSGRSLHNTRPSDYKRSERGLSYLFPSLSEHNLSLLDKVKVTVMRHKNNYFLDWTEEQLTQIDPLIRPKMVVTPELYKEYCHRNAMKYDSNLQFAMESPEQWAQDFRAKLMKPPSHGGFSSLCEVKLEAGRLWRQFSGKYRMHNIVKWHMDLNNATATALPSQGANDERSGSNPESGPDHSPKDGSDHLRNSKKKSLSSPSLQSSSNRDGLLNTAPKVPNEAGLTSDRAKVHSRLKHRVDSKLSLVDGNKPSTQGSSVKVVRPGTDIIIDHNDNSLSADESKPARLLHEDHPMDRRNHESFSPKNDDCLFHPLPKYLSVFDQVCVWLERHKHNYFLGYPPHKLSEVPEIVRPLKVVTESVFKRYVPESMVDVISKIDLMISCDTGWSRDFQDKLQRGREEGGFATFEEALTEAVLVWESSQARLLASGWLKEPAADTLNAHSAAAPEVDNVDYDGKKSKISDTHDDLEAQGQGQGHKVMNNPSKSSSRCATVVKTLENDNTALTAARLPSGKAPSNGGSGMQEGSCPEGGALWRCRAILQQLCGDNPSQSWHRRMQPFLPTLQRHLGTHYSCPSTASDCLVDLVLAVVQEELDHSK